MVKRPSIQKQQRPAWLNNQPAAFQHGAGPVPNQLVVPDGGGFPAWLSKPTTGGNPWLESQRDPNVLRLNGGAIVIQKPGTGPSAQPFNVPGQTLEAILAANGVAQPAPAADVSAVVDPGPRDTNFLASAPLAEVREWQAQRAAFAAQQQKAGGQ